MKSRYLLLLLLFTFNFCSQPEDQQPAFIEELESPTGINASLPYLLRGEDGKLYLSWIEQKDSLASFYFSVLKDNKWTSPEKITEGTNWFINWADYPTIAVDKEGNKMAHYLAKNASGTYSYDVKIITQKKDSLGWSIPLPPHTDNTPTEHGFVTMLPNNNGTFTLAWLDGRNTEGNSGHDGHSANGAMTLRTAIVDMEGNLSGEYELDNRVCDCCQTTGTVTRDGPMFVYRDRSVDEVRDIAYTTLTEKWQKPKLVAEDNWSITGCPVNGPRMDSHGETAAVAWYTEALGRPKIKVVFGNSNGFNKSYVADDTSPVGRVDLVIIDDQSAVVSWIDGGKNPAIKYRIVNSNGSMSSVFTVNTTSEARGSGFPQMEYYEGQLFFAWTDVGNPNKIRIKKVAID